MIILNAKEILPSFKEALKEKSLETPLSFLLYSEKENADCQSYIKSIKRMLDAFDIPYTESFYDNNKTDDENLLNFKEEIQNRAVLIARPLPTRREEDFIRLIPSAQDPDMLTEINRGKLYGGDLSYLPATAKSVLKIMEYFRLSSQGKKVTILGRSISVGLPLFEYFLKSDATVTLCHSKPTKEDLKNAVMQCDILVLATGVKNLIDSSWLDSSKIIIDCGFGNGSGDLNFIPNENQAYAYTPVPGGVGVLTSYCLLENAFIIRNK